MSHTTQRPTGPTVAPRQGRDPVAYDTGPRQTGWVGMVVFAGMMLVMLGGVPGD